MLVYGIQNELPRKRKSPAERTTGPEEKGLCQAFR